MHRATLLLLLACAPLQASTAFNLDAAHPVVWHQHAENFGSKVAFRNNNGDGYGLFVQAPDLNRDYYSKDKWFQCYTTGRERPTCTPEDSESKNADVNIKHGIPLKSTWSEEPVEWFFDPDGDDKVCIRRSSHGDGEPIWQSQHGQYVCDISWCVADLNKDRSDDLVLGLQLRSYKHKMDKDYQVLIYINKGALDLHKQVKIIGGKQSYLQSARSVSCIGDINSDGFQDIAVGAPGEDDGRGAIYIYHGSEGGIDLDYSQRISAADLGEKGGGIFGFGTSISGGADFDGNHYDDVAVGASGSNHAVLLLARPVVRLQVNFNTSTYKLTESNRRILASCVMNFTASKDQEPFDVEIALQSNTSLCNIKISTCAERSSDTAIYNENITLHAGPVERSFRLELKEGAKVPTGPIRLKLRYKLAESSTAEFCKTCPVVDPKDKSEVTIEVDHGFSCGGDICRTDLKLHAEFIDNPAQILPRGNGTVKIYASVENLMQTAFQTVLTVTAPPAWRMVSTQMYREDTVGSVKHIKLDVRAPIDSETGPRSFFVELQVKDVAAGTDQLQFNVSVTSMGEEQHEDDNFRTLTLRVHPSTTEESLTTSTIQTEGSSVSNSEHGHRANLMPSCTPKWVLVVSPIVGVVLGALLVVAVVTVCKRLKTLRTNNTEAYIMEENLEPVYEVPGPSDESSYSRYNQYYETSK